jgi:thioredoxin
VDYDLNPEISQRYHVLGLPTMALFSQGEMVARIVGAKPRTAIMRELEPHLAPR